MANTRSGDQQDPSDPYSLLGVDRNSTFEDIQKARENKLIEAGDDLLLKAKIESSYDSLLMDSLKARQLGRMSNEAVNASQKEKNGGNVNLPVLKNSLLTKIKSFSSTSSSNTQDNSFISLPDGEGLTIRLSLGVFVIVLLLVASDSYIQIILSVSTIGLFISQLKRGRKAISSLGWSVVFLSTGYILGGLIVSNIELANNHSLLLSLDKIEALPVLILLWIGAILLG